MKHGKSDTISPPVHEYLCESGDIRFRIISGAHYLKEIEFFNGAGFRPTGSPAPPHVKIMIEWLKEYFSGGDTEKFSIILRYNNQDIIVRKGSKSDLNIHLDMERYTDKEIKVYSELVKVPTGEKISYGELAAKSGVPGGARFIGNAMAKNRFPVIIPCHRVIRSDGSTGNFSGGVDIKEKLLKLEKDYRKL